MTDPSSTPASASRQKKFFAGSRDGKRPLTSDPLEGAKDHYDVVVIGSGLGGLTAANILARNVHSVAVLEQHYNYGGLATWFKRKGGHVFDISLHGFPFGMKKTCRKYWGQHVADKIVQLDGQTKTFSSQHPHPRSRGNSNEESISIIRQRDRRK